MLRLMTLLLIGACVFGASAAEVERAESALDKRVTELTQDLRCLVCQNQSIADSQAPLAIDLKNQVREKMAKGMSDKQIVDYMVERYGDFVLYRPPVKSTTALLWFGPALLLVGGVAALVLVLRKRSRLGAEAFDPEPDDDGIRTP